MIATTSEDAEGVCKSVAWLGNEEIAISGDAFIYRHTLNPKYVAYIFQTSRFLEHKIQYSTGAKVVRMSADNIARFLIPIPPLSKQKRIVSILDRFKALTTYLTASLPAELKAIQQHF